MKYFEGVTDLEIAKHRYRELAKQLHPDKGGSAAKFQRMQEDYKLLLIRIQQNHNSVIRKQPSIESELISELATMLIKKQVPQEYLKQRITKSQSPMEQKICSGIISFLDKLA